MSMRTISVSNEHHSEGFVGVPLLLKINGLDAIDMEDSWREFSASISRANASPIVAAIFGDGQRCEKWGYLWDP